MVYDFIFVGTSPMCLLEACARRLSGHSVLMIDRASVPGGAWKTHEMFGHDDIENGPHFLLYPGGDKFLRDELGIDLKVVPRPEWLICDRARPGRIGDGAAMMRFGGSILLKSLAQFASGLRHRRRRDFVSGLKLGRKGWQKFGAGVSFALLRPKSWYLRNGSGPLVRALDRYARGLGIDFIMDARIAKATVEGGQTVRVDFSGANQGSAQARQLMLTDHSCIETFDLGGGNIHETQFDRRIRTQVHFGISTRRPLDFYLLRFFSTKYLLLSNLSYVYDRKIAPSGQELLTLALLDVSKAHAVSRDDMQRIVAEFESWGMLPEKTELGEFVVTHYDDPRVLPKSRRVISAGSNGRIAFFGRPDISELIAERAEFWRQSGLRNGALNPPVAVAGSAA